MLLAISGRVKTWSQATSLSARGLSPKLLVEKTFSWRALRCIFKSHYFFFLMSQSQCPYSDGFSSFPNFHWHRDAHGCISGVKIFALRSAGNGEARHKSVFSHCCRSDPCEVPSFLWTFWKWKAGAGWLLSSAPGNSCIAVITALHICCQALFHLIGEGLRDTDKGAPGTGSDPEPLQQPC